MNKHSERIAKMKVRERRHRAVAILAKESSVGERHYTHAVQLRTGVEVLERSVKKRAAAHRGERTPQKSTLRREYQRLLLVLRHLPDEARTSPEPLTIMSEATRVVCRLMELAELMGIKVNERPSADAWLADVDIVVRFRTQNEPAQVEERLRTIKLHQARERGKPSSRFLGWPCWCSVCRHIRAGEMTVDGVYVDTTKSRRTR